VQSLNFSALFSRSCGISQPVVAVFIVWLCDDHHDLPWIAGGSLITLGLVSHYIHRLLHYYITKGVVKKAAADLLPRPTSGASRGPVWIELHAADFARDASVVIAND